MKTVANREVRDAIKHSGAYQYEIAYAIGISEAISDETAAQILRDFTGDMEIMQRFRSVLEKQIAPSDRQIADQYGNTTFPQTFGQLFKYEKFRDALAELQEMADTLFIRKLSQTETEYLHGATLSVPTDGYVVAAVGRKIAKEHRKAQTPHGKQSVRKLMGHGGDTNAIEVDTPKLFDKVARKWGVDYAIRRVGDEKYLLLFKARQADAITGCFAEYSRLELKRAKSRQTPIREQLRQAEEQVKKQPQRELTKEVAHGDR